MIDLHRHDEFSNFDGFDKATRLARIAKEKKLKALGIANHGNVNGLVEHYNACIENEIKPVMGSEVYFQPKFDKEVGRYHLCLFAKNIIGYENLNRIITEANRDNFYYHPIVTYELLEKYHDGIICTSACLAGLISSLIIRNDITLQDELNHFMSIFGDDYYIEIMPYKVRDVNLQETVNEKLIDIAKKNDIKLILTSDSHYGAKEDFETYTKMHQIAGFSDINTITETYKERYMPSADELYERFASMHSNHKNLLNEIITNMDNLVNKVDDKILDNLKLKIPKYDDTKDSKQFLHDNLVDGLKKLNLYNEQYIDRMEKEYEVIIKHGFEDYFLIVYDYVSYAKNNDIKIGFGRGSVCNSLVAYALGITETDPIFFNLDFNRFLRPDKKKLPDIDLDFEISRRDEVINYIVEKYKGKAVQICSYGLYKVDNLINDLCKVCGVEGFDKKAIKDFVNEYVIEGVLNFTKFVLDVRYTSYNKQYDNIIIHFTKLYKQIKYIGTHAAGVAIVSDDIVKYTAIQRSKDKFISAYALLNLESINVIKFDILGLKTMSEIRELENMTKQKFSYSIFTDNKIIDEFNHGNTNGIFQFEKKAAKNILVNINADCTNDIIAASALNRPGPLSLKMPEKYAKNKMNSKASNDSKFWEYTKETYGTIVYQEQIMAVCYNIGEMNYADIDKVMKFLKGGSIVESVLKRRDAEEKDLRNKFVTGAKKHGYTETEANELFDNLIVYSFNKGHATGYTAISIYQMFYKVYYPAQFWFIKIKYADEDNLESYKQQAARSGVYFLTPHVNFSKDYTYQELKDKTVIIEGLQSIKNVGEKAALAIEEERAKNGKYTSYDNFIGRVKKRQVNKKVVDALMANNALEFDKEKYFTQVRIYNGM